MANPVWGMLTKSQSDSETIEQAIARIVAEHEADEEAHLGVGDSLQSHKASEIIDHLASSIIADKLDDKAVTVDKLDYDRFLIHSNFESLDAFSTYLVGANSRVVTHLGELEIRVGGNVNDQALISSSMNSTAITNEKNPSIQVTVMWADDPSADCDWSFGFSDSSPLSPARGCFGFKWDDSEGKLYAFYYDTSLNTYEIPDIVPTSPITLRAECSYDPGASAGARDTLKFYVDGELVKTWTGVNCPSDASYLFGLQIKSISDSSPNYWYLYASNLTISMDYDT